MDMEMVILMSEEEFEKYIDVLGDEVMCKFLELDEVQMEHFDSKLTKLIMDRKNKLCPPIL